MKIEIVSVTPELAATWLATNTEKNRRLSKVTVNRYAQDMLRGKWLATGEAIKFDCDGKLIDGQHRLSAVVVSKKSVEMLVVRDLEQATMTVLDTGKSRSAGDALTITGVADGNALQMASLARKIIAHQNGYLPLSAEGRSSIRVKGESIPNHRVVEFCQKNDISAHCSFAHRMKYSQLTNALSHGEYAFFHYLFSQIDTGAAETFLSKVATLEDVPANSPVRALVQKLSRSAIALDGKMKMRAIITAWNAWRSGSSLSAIHVGRFAADEPIPQAV